MTETTLALPRSASCRPPRLRERLARKLVFRILDRVRDARLIVVDADGEWIFGETGSVEQVAVVHVREPRAYVQMALEGSVGAGRSYADGCWTASDLTTFVRIMARNQRALARSRAGLGRLMDLRGRRHRWQKRNTLRGSRENISAHYDLSNEFFSTFLDSRMMYSSAFFASEDTSLEAASRAKLERICGKLDLTPGDHLLEIGTGWGGLALHAAGEYGCRVTTTTLSGEQYRYARARVRERGLEDRITVLNRDYRELQGRFDKLVSVEMIEAVGPQFLDGFFRICSQLLTPNGLMLLQAITIDDREYERAARSEDFIKRFIFPGSCIPSVARMMQATARYTDLRLLDLEDLTPHYAETLSHWRQRFRARSETLTRLGFDERFQRLWDFYFAYCEGGFLERRIGDVHMVLAKPEYRESRWNPPRRGREH